MVAHAYNPSYSGDGGRRILSLKAAKAKLARLYLKKGIKTKGLGAWLKVLSSVFRTTIRT
jgi:hypothetical protein